MHNNYNLYLIIIILILLIIAFIIILLTKNDISCDCDNDTVEKMDRLNLETTPIFIVSLDRKPERYKYVTGQLDSMGMKNYQKWSATDGSKTNTKEIMADGITQKLIERGNKAEVGCASSHIRLWKYIRANKLDWTLILEDDAHFHPEFISIFNKYWKNIPIDAKIVFPGHGGQYLPNFQKNRSRLVYQNHTVCLHAYIINWTSAQYLLDKLLPMDKIVDVAVYDHFADHYGSFVFNGNAKVNEIRPDDYKLSKGKKCECDGIIYQNQEEYISTLKI